MRRSFVFVVLFGALALAGAGCARPGGGWPAASDGNGRVTQAGSPSPDRLSARGLPLADLEITRSSTTPSPVSPSSPAGSVDPRGSPGGEEPILRLTVDVADTPEASERGLMGVEHLPDDEGMVFLWDQPSTVAFWMKDTLIPLDIAFWDQKGRIFDIQQMQPCTVPEGQTAYTACPLYSPREPYMGALEVNLGLLERNGVRPGSTVKLTRR